MRKIYTIATITQGRTGYQKAQVAKSTERRQYGKITESKRRQCSKMKEKAKGAGVIAHLAMYDRCPGLIFCVTNIRLRARHVCGLQFVRRDAFSGTSGDVTSFGSKGLASSFPLGVFCAILIK